MISRQLLPLFYFFILFLSGNDVDEIAGSDAGWIKPVRQASRKRSVLIGIVVTLGIGVGLSALFYGRGSVSGFCGFLVFFSFFGFDFLSGLGFQLRRLGGHLPILHGRIAGGLGGSLYCLGLASCRFGSPGPGTCRWILLRQPHIASHRVRFGTQTLGHHWHRGPRRQDGPAHGLALLHPAPGVHLVSGALLQITLNWFWGRLRRRNHPVILLCFPTHRFWMHRRQERGMFGTN